MIAAQRTLPLSPPSARPTMHTLSQLVLRIALACGVALGVGVLGAMAWSQSDAGAETASVAEPQRH